MSTNSLFGAKVPPMVMAMAMVEVGVTVRVRLRIRFRVRCRVFITFRVIMPTTSLSLFTTGRWRRPIVRNSTYMRSIEKLRRILNESDFIITTYLSIVGSIVVVVVIYGVVDVITILLSL